MEIIFLNLELPNLEESEFKMNNIIKDGSEDESESEDEKKLKFMDKRHANNCSIHFH